MKNAWLLLVPVVLVIVFYAVACGPVNQIRADMDASRLESAARAHGYGDRVNFRGHTDGKGAGYVTGRIDFGGLGPDESVDLLRVLHEARRPGDAPYMSYAALGVNGVTITSNRLIPPEILQATEPLTRTPGLIQAIDLSYGGHGVDVTGAPCIRVPDRAECIRAQFDPVVEGYAALAPVQLEHFPGRRVGHQNGVGFSFESGPLGRVNRNTIEGGTPDPEAFRRQLEQALAEADT